MQVDVGNNKVQRPSASSSSPKNPALYPRPHQGSENSSQGGAEKRARRKSQATPTTSAREDVKTPKTIPLGAQVDPSPPAGRRGGGGPSTPVASSSSARVGKPAPRQPSSNSIRRSSAVNNQSGAEERPASSKERRRSSGVADDDGLRKSRSSAMASGERGGGGKGGQDRPGSPAQAAEGARPPPKVDDGLVNSNLKNDPVAPAAPAAKPGPKLAQTKVKPGMRLKRWLILNRIGAGSFGETFTAMEVNWQGPPEEPLTVTAEAASIMANLPPPEERTEVCIKVEQENKNVLRLEALALKKVQSCTQVVRYLGSGCTSGMNFLVMEKLGPNLAELRRRSPYLTFNMYTTLKAGISCLTAIRGVHDQGLVHRDIKPSNFVTGLPGTPEHTTCYIIDFGLARRFRRSNGEIRPPRDNAGFRGTSRYASVASHHHEELGRVDDLWSLLFMMVEFATGTLPWRKYKDKDDIGRCKEEAITPHLVRNLPREFQAFLAHLQTLRYQDEPDYDLLLSLMNHALERRGYPADKPLDWELYPATAEGEAAAGKDAPGAAAGGDAGQPPRRAAPQPQPSTPPPGAPDSAVRASQGGSPGAAGKQQPQPSGDDKDQGGRRGGGGKRGSASRNHGTTPPSDALPPGNAGANGQANLNNSAVRVSEVEVSYPAGVSGPLAPTRNPASSHNRRASSPGAEGRGGTSEDGRRRGTSSVKAYAGDAGFDNDGVGNNEGSETPAVQASSADEHDAEDYEFSPREVDSLREAGGGKNQNKGSVSGRPGKANSSIAAAGSAAGGNGSHVMNDESTASGGGGPPNASPPSRDSKGRRKSGGSSSGGVAGLQASPDHYNAYGKPTKEATSGASKKKGSKDLEDKKKSTCHCSMA